MAKIWKYIWVSASIIFLLKLAGLPTGAQPVFDLLQITFNAVGNIAGFDFSTSTFFNNLFRNTGTALGSLVTAGLVVGAVVAGLLTRAKPENLIILGFSTGILILFTSTGISIIAYAISLGTPWVAAIISFLFIPWTVGFITALAEFFRGTD